jgi:alpha-N-arabinofuranosidase
MPDYRCRPVILLLAALLVCAGPADTWGADARITVNAALTTGRVNPLLFGQNILFASNSLWNARLNDIDPAVKPLLKPIKPAMVRFPGGSASDLYLWEDGIGLRTTTPVTPTTAAIALDGTPDWRTVTKARLVDTHDGQFGDVFQFIRPEANRLVGVMGVKNQHPAGVDVRPEVRLGQSDWFSNTYGTIEHLRLVRSLQALPMFTVNYSTGLDGAGQLSTRISLSQKTKRAAAWVAFVNGRPDDQRSLGVDDEGRDWHTVGYWAQQRVARGYAQPWGVAYWEIGNEVYDKNEVGFTSARQYAQDFIAFAQAMRAVDPGIKLGAVGMTVPEGLGDADSRDAWNPTVVKVAGDYLDFLVIHPYYPAGAGEPGLYRSERWLTAIMAGADQAMADLKAIRQVINANAPAGKHLDIAVTEYGIWPISKDPLDFANLARALFDADLLLSLIQDGSRLGINLATAWHLHGSNPTAAIGYNWNTGTRTLRPHYHAMGLILNHLYPDLIETQVSSPTFAVSRVTNVKAKDAVPLLHAVAFRSPDRQRVSLMVVNRSLKSRMATMIQIQGFTPQGGAAVWSLSGNSVLDHNENLSTTVTPKAARLPDAGPGFTYDFEPHSLTVLAFKAQGASPPAGQADR